MMSANVLPSTKRAWIRPLSILNIIFIYSLPLSLPLSFSFSLSSYFFLCLFFFLSPLSLSLLLFLFSPISIFLFFLLSLSLFPSPSHQKKVKKNLTSLVLLKAIKMTKMEFYWFADLQIFLVLVNKTNNENTQDEKNRFAIFNIICPCKLNVTKSSISFLLLKFGEYQFNS